MTIPPSSSFREKATFTPAHVIDTADHQSERRVKIDYSQSVNPDRSRRDNMPTNDGTRDIGNAQTAVLLLRGLNHQATPEIIHQALDQCGASNRAGGGSPLERVIVLKHRQTMLNLGFAFAEFSSVKVSASNHP